MKKQGESTVIFVNPVYRIPTQGRDKQPYQIDMGNGQIKSVGVLGKTRELNTSYSLQFQMKTSTERLNTGLDEMVDNPFYEWETTKLKEAYHIGPKWDGSLKLIVDAKKIKKQTLFEIEDGVDPDTYTSEMKGGNIFSARALSRQITDDVNYLQTFKVILYDRPNRFTDETPRGRMAIQLMKMHNKVANSKAEANSSMHDYYISEEHEAERETLKKRDKINDAIYNMEKLKREYSAFQAYQVAVLLRDHQNEPLVQGTVSEMRVKTILNNYLTSNTRHQMKNIEKFNEVFELLTSKQGMLTLKIKYLIQQAMNTNVITARDGKYIWHSKIGSGDNISSFRTLDKMIAHFASEYAIYNEEDDSTNWYGELLREVKGKEVRFE